MGTDDETWFKNAAVHLISKTRTVAACAYKTSFGQPSVYPEADLLIPKCNFLGYNQSLETSIQLGQFNS
jgi:hypothetical protein